ncbi:serine/threonine-protein kinase [Candidatus Chlorohelix sp.]|uniref:serine/threonine-protein kinase n=1 Tax=Candidatus Chlorohelix sp. TaxID=3139201 RepID=UPI00303F8E25
MLQAGDVISGTYRLERRLGKGGMGEVWLAHHNLLDESRAIKIVLGELAENTQLRDRFVRGEARNALRLERHPNIVRVYELSQHKNMPYMVMEYVEGKSLRDLMNLRKPMPLFETGEILRQVAAGLEAAHRQGMIHRDIKPANVLIDEKNGNIAKLTDFGLVKNLDSDGDSGLTATGQYMGTPFYMAPEQAHGNADKRSDIYSLGAMVYEMLAGRPPFIGATTSVIVQHVTTPPPPLREFNPTVPADVQNVILRALAKTPEDRFQSATEFYTAYQHALNISNPNYSEKTTPLGMVEPMPNPSTFDMYQNPQTPSSPNPAHISGANTPPDLKLPNVANQTPTPTPTGEKFGKMPLLVIIGSVILILATVVAMLLLIVSGNSSSSSNGASAVTIGAFRPITASYPLPTRNGESRILAGVPQNNITAMDISPDGSVIATSYSNATLITWRAETGKELTRLTGFNGSVNGLRFSQDGKQLLGCGSASSLLIWNMPDGKILRTLEGQTVTAVACDFINSGKTVYSIAEDNSRRQWELNNPGNTPANVQPGQRLESNLVTFSPDGKFVAVIDKPQNLSITNLTTFSEAGRIALQTNENITAVAFSPSGNVLATAVDDGSLRFWNIIANQNTMSFNPSVKLALPNTETLSALLYTPDGKFLIAGNSEGHLEVWEAEQGKQIAESNPHERSITRLKLMPGSKQVVTASNDNTVAISTLEGLKLDKSIGSASSPARTMALSPEGQQVAFTQNKKIVLFDLAKGTIRYQLEGHKNTPYNLAFSLDGKRLVSTSYDELLLWDTEAGKQAEIAQFDNAIGGIAFSPDGKKLAVGSYKQVYLYDTSNYRIAKELKPNTQEEISATSLAFSDNQTLALVWGNKNTYLWNINGNEQPKLLTKEDDNIATLAISPDKKLLAVGSSGKVRMYDLPSGKERLLLDTKDYAVRQLTFDSSGKRLAAALPGNNIIIWQLLNQTPVSLQGHQDSITGFAFVLDENYGLSASEDGTLRIWKV